MKIGGYRTLSTVDFPGKVVATLFIAGCNFTCEYCHNYEMITEEGEGGVEFSDILAHLEKRKNVLDGVCISGGEPLLHFDEVIELISEIKKRFPHFLIKLDTNGSSMEKIQKIVHLVNFIAVDFKGIEYKNYAKFPVDIQTIIEFLNGVTIEYEIRMTLYPDYFPKEEFEKIAILLENAKSVALQQYSTEHVREKKIPYDRGILESFKEILEKKIPKITLRY